MSMLLAALVAAAAILTASPSSTQTMAPGGAVVQPMDVIPPMGL